MAFCQYESAKWRSNVRNSNFEWKFADICLKQRRVVCVFPSMCNCLSASWQQCCWKLRIENIHVHWTGFWQWENDDMCLEVVNLLFLTALFWSATASNCQGCCFALQWAALACSKSGISGERDSFQGRLLVFDSCYVFRDSFQGRLLVLRVDR